MPMFTAFVFGLLDFLLFYFLGQCIYILFVRIRN